MAYRKMLIDNVTCSRRFHLTFDDEAPVAPRVEVRCDLCDIVIFSADNHPPVSLARDENLVKTASLSEHVISDCQFEDKLSQRTIKDYKGGKLYEGGRP